MVRRSRGIHKKAGACVSAESSQEHCFSALNPLQAIKFEDVRDKGVVLSGLNPAALEF